MNKYSRLFVNFFESTTSEVSRKRKYCTTQTVKVVHHFCLLHCNIPMKGKKVRDTFFTRDEEDDTKWTYRCGKVHKVKGSGYTNFVTHVQSFHPEAYAELIRTDGWNKFSVTSTRSDRSSIAKNNSFLPNLFESMDLSILWFLDCSRFLS